MFIVSAFGPTGSIQYLSKPMAYDDAKDLARLLRLAELRVVMERCRGREARARATA
jgi:hypothetical protein